MVKSYLRHGPTEAFGVIASSSSNSLFDGRKAYVPALEDVLVWDVKKAEQTAMWHETGLKSLVTCLCRSPTNWDTFAVGYQDGSIRIWSAEAREVVVTLNGHKSAVTALAFDPAGTVLASGSKDTDVIVWDIVGEVGLFRLRGHRDQVTGLAFVSPRSESDEAEQEDGTADEPSTSTNPPQSTKPSTHLLTTSKDTFLKLFSLQTQHCVSTTLAHRTEAWSLTYDPNSGVIITGGGEGEIKCWQLVNEVLVSAHGGPTTDKDGKLSKAILPIPPLSLSSSASHNHNITQVTLHPTLPVLAVLSSEKTVDVFRLRTVEELRKKLARRRRREREKKEKMGKKGKGKAVEADDDEDEEMIESKDGTVEWRDRLAVWSVVRCGAKIRSFSFAPETAKTKGQVQIMAALNNNSVEVFTLPPAASSKSPLVEAETQFTLDLAGHRSDVRALAVSSDDVLLASASTGAVKIWNIKTTKCIRTLECGYALCCTFLPGDRHLVVGTKAGEILLFDLSSSSLLETFEAHTGPVWSLDVRPDSRGLVSGSGDKDIKFWEFEVREVRAEVDGNDADAVGDGADDGEDKAQPGMARVLTMAHTKTLKMTDDVLAVKYSPDGRLLAVSLLDSTVKVFYADTLKFFLSLYGHKLPVLSLDISSDSKLIITCSADKNIKIWGLDFGDCHRSLFGHEESIMQVAFERGSHYFWSVGKDKMLKYWDGDKFECIQKLAGHHGEIWALAVSRRANFVVTGSHDKSIRIWEKTDEPLFLEEERERELEELYDSNVNGREGRDELRVLPNGEEVVPAESTDVSKSTTETLMAGERIMEALEISEADRALTKAYEEEVEKVGPEGAKALPSPSRNPIFGIYNNCGPEEYVLKVVQRIPAASLHDALLVLPFGKVTLLIEHLDFWAHKEWHITLTSRVLFFLLRTHHSQIVATRALRNTMLSLRKNLREALRRQKDTVGYNLAALKYIQRQHESAKQAEFYESAGGGTMVMADEETVRAKIEAGVKKRRRAALKS
ncbi:WD40 repeat-like protein [Meredithblackwellia eburnea MCA 4105]